MNQLGFIVCIILIMLIAVSTPNDIRALGVDLHVAGVKIDVAAPVLTLPGSGNECKINGADCRRATDCCSTNCGTDNKCFCQPRASFCSSDIECCDNSCNGVFCGCKRNGFNCTKDYDCCSGNCDARGICFYCFKMYKLCSRDVECCSGACEPAKIRPRNSNHYCYCKGIGERCNSDDQCCSLKCGECRRCECNPTYTDHLCKSTKDCCNGTTCYKFRSYDTFGSCILPKTP